MEENKQLRLNLATLKENYTNLQQQVSEQKVLIASQRQNLLESRELLAQQGRLTIDLQKKVIDQFESLNGNL